MASCKLGPLRLAGAADFNVKLKSNAKAPA